MKSGICSSFLFSFLFLFSTYTFAQQLPSFSFTGLDKKAFTNAQLKPGNYTMVLFFDPYCDHCTMQAKWIAERPDLFKDVQMLWVTTEMAEGVTSFYNQYLKNSKLANVHMLLDQSFMFDSFFGYSEVMSIYLYDKSGKLIKSLKEEMPAAEIRKILDSRG